MKAGVLKAGAVLTVVGILAAVSVERRVSAQQITQCQAVGCYGGRPGCWWFGDPKTNVTLCFGER